MGDKTLVADLVRHGGNIDGQDSRQGVEGSTALIMAALKDELVAVRTLVECGANVPTRLPPSKAGMERRHAGAWVTKHFAVEP